MVDEKIINAAKVLFTVRFKRIEAAMLEAGHPIGVVEWEDLSQVEQSEYIEDVTAVADALAQPASIH